MSESKAPNSTLSSLIVQLAFSAAISALTIRTTAGRLAQFDEPERARDRRTAQATRALPTKTTKCCCELVPVATCAAKLNASKSFLGLAVETRSLVLGAAAFRAATEAAQWFL